MSDDSFDPWQSLAADLGVDASKAPAPLPPPAPPRPTTSSSNLPPAASKAADWRALAGELGIEVPAEPEQPIKRADPVAELLGFPPPAPSQFEGDDTRKNLPRHERRSGQFEDRDPEGQSWDDTKPADIEEDEFERSESTQFESREETEESTEVRERDANDRPRRRRRRGGRGRGRGRRDERSDREDRGRDRDRAPSDSEGHRESAEVPEPQTSSMDPDELRDAQEHAFAEAVEEMEQNRSRYGSTFEHDPDRQRRRRRGRRGRGRSRERNERNELVRDSGNVPERRTSDDFEGEDEPQGSYTGGADEASEFEPLQDEDVGTTASASANGEEDPHHTDELHAKSSVRDIVTWKEAIGMIIAGNMEARARNPQQASGSHGGGRGSRGGRGRGRGRGRHSG